MVMSLGPRVGGAHVDVNMAFNPKSLDDVGRRIHRQLARIGQRNGRIYRRMGADAVIAWRAALGTIVSSAPHMGAAISGVVGAATMLVGALRETIVASSGLIGVAGSLGLAMMTASFGFNHIMEAIQETDLKKVEELLGSMTPPAREFTLAMRELRDELRAEIQPRIFAGLLVEMQALRKDFIPMVTRGFLGMADAINVLIKDMTRYATSKNGMETINTALEGSVTIFEHLSKAVVPFLDGFLKLHNALIPASIRLSDRITNIAERFQDWASAPGFAERIDKRMKAAEKTAGLLLGTLKNLWSGLGNVFTAAGPATDGFLQMLLDVSERFKEWSSSVEGEASILKWATDAGRVMEQLGKTFSAFFGVTTDLASPDAIITFLRAVEHAFTILGKLPLEKMVDGFVRLTEIMEPISGPILAIVIAFASMQLIFGNILGQLAGVIGTFMMFMRLRTITGLLKGTSAGVATVGNAATTATTKLGFFSRIWAKILDVIGKVRAFFGGTNTALAKTGSSAATAAGNASRLSGVFSNVLKILGRFAKVAGIAGIVIWVVTLIAKSKDLQGKLKEMFSAFGEVFGALKEAFSEIITALQPLFEGLKKAGAAISPVFDVLDKIATLGIGLVIDAITFAFKSLANVIKGAGRIIAGIIDIFVGMKTLDGSKIIGGFKKIFSGIGPLLKGAFGLFVTFFAPAKILKIFAPLLKKIPTIGINLIKGLLVGIGGAIGRVGTFIVDTIVNAVKSLFGINSPSTVFAEFGMFLIQGLINGISAVVGLVVNTFSAMWESVKTVFITVFNFLRDMVVAYFTLYVTIVRTVFGAIWGVITAVWDTIKAVFVAAFEYIKNRLVNSFNFYYNLIKNVMTTVWTAIKTVWDTIKKVFSAALDFIKGVISRAMENIKNNWSKAFNWVKDTATRIWNSIKSFFDNAVGKIRTTFGKIGDAIKSPFKSAFNAIATMWNSTVGKLTFQAPDWVPGIGGKGWSMPKIPKYAMGTNFAPGGLALVGERGPELVNLPRGSKVYPNSRSERMMGGNTYNITMNVDMSSIEQIRTMEEFVAMFERARVEKRKTQRSGYVTA